MQVAGSASVSLVCFTSCAVVAVVTNIPVCISSLNSVQFFLHESIEKEFFSLCSSKMIHYF